MIKITNIYLILLIFGCAYQGAPKGGPKDVRGPKLSNIIPINESELIDDNKIIISFDENISPNTIINSISTNPAIDIITKVKKNKIIISPLDTWPKDELIKINLNRSISDFHSNHINQNIQLLYNLNNREYCSINGNLKNYRENIIYNIFVYSWPLDIANGPLDIINTDNDYSFTINYLEQGKYILIASEGNLDIYNNYYGVNTIDYIELDENDCAENISIYIDEPLEKLKLTRVETVNSNFLNIFYDNNIMEPYLIDSDIGDSIYVNLKRKNRLHEYSIEPYLYIVKEKLDTIPPSIISVKNSDSIIVINFSEPINYKKLLMECNRGDDWVQVDYNKISPVSIEFTNNEFTKIRLLSEFAEDLNGNTMLDSINMYDISDIPEFEGNSFLSGKITGNFAKDIIVEAKNISLNLFYRYEIEDSVFIFDNLQSGQYIFRAYEKKNNIDPLIYHSGLLNPYERAAEFSIYRDTVEVRKFWDVEGINIEF